MPESRRHQRRAQIARARAKARAQTSGQRASVRPNNRRRLLIAGGVVLIAAVVAIILITTNQSTPLVAPAATASVTPVALPDFGQVAETTAADTSTPADIATPTPGLAGPTAVVVTNSPWQVLVARNAVPDLQAPSSVAVDGEGNLYVVDFQGNFVQKFSPGGQPLGRFGQKGNAPGQFAGPMDV